jgi:hypothetical protein
MRLARGTTTYFCPAAADRHSIEARATEEFRDKLSTMKNSLTTMKNSASSIVSGADVKRWAAPYDTKDGRVLPVILTYFPRSHS